MTTYGCMTGRYCLAKHMTSCQTFTGTQHDQLSNLHSTHTQNTQQLGQNPMQITAYSYRDAFMNRDNTWSKNTTLHDVHYIIERLQ